MTALPALRLLSPGAGDQSTTVLLLAWDRAIRLAVLARFGLLAVWPGALAPAGVYAAGLTFGLRDAVHDLTRPRSVLAAVALVSTADLVPYPMVLRVCASSALREVELSSTKPSGGRSGGRTARTGGPGGAGRRGLVTPRRPAPAGVTTVMSPHGAGGKGQGHDHGGHGSTL